MYYFAYGSNMNLDHMRRLCGWHFHVLGKAYLENYELGPDLRGFATVRVKDGEQVWGVLFEIDQTALDSMDDFEGYPDIFNRREAQVKDEKEKSFKAWFYLEPEDQFGGKSLKEAYLRRALIGARENHLPKEWLAYLESLGE
jgi:gamma-glutamylcyclotransferase (GGCT)/AIG2-like uncharacterized protein YtfP